MSLLISHLITWTLPLHTFDSLMFFIFHFFKYFLLLSPLCSYECFHLYIQHSILWYTLSYWIWRIEPYKLFISLSRDLASSYFSVILTCFITHNFLKISFCCKWQHLIFPYDLIVLHCMDVSYLLYPIFYQWGHSLNVRKFASLMSNIKKLLFLLRTIRINLRCLPGWDE